MKFNILQLNGSKTEAILVGTIIIIRRTGDGHTHTSQGVGMKEGEYDNEIPIKKRWNSRKIQKERETKVKYTLKSKT